MDNELTIMLQAVIQEALEPIHKSLGQVESNMSTKQELQDTRAEMKNRFDTLETKISLVEKDVSNIKQDVSDIKSTVDRMAAETPDDIMGMLKQINAKLEEKNSDVQALNRRLFRTESVVEKLSKQ